MSIVPDVLVKLFARSAQVLSWQWVPDDHIVDDKLHVVPPAATFAAQQDYVVLRLAEMYLKTIRVLWRERYPVVHAFVAYGDAAAQRGVTTVAGPGQLKDLGTTNLDRLIGLAYRLAGPLVYDGHDLDLLAGLYAVPARDGAKPLLDTLSQLAGVMPGFAQVDAIAGVLKTGMEGLLGIADTELVLGIRDSLKPEGAGQGRIARPGFLVASNAPQAELDPSRLWVREGRLHAGANPVAARPYDAHDMMLFELHRGPSRVNTFATLPVLSERVREFDAILRDAPTGELEAKLGPSYRNFEADLRAITDLTVPDKAAIRALVADDLRKRVKEIRSGGLFETRDVGGRRAEVELRAFSARALPELPPNRPLPARDSDQPLF
jgi:hypothetical protein